MSKSILTGVTLGLLVASAGIVSADSMSPGAPKSAVGKNGSIQLPDEEFQLTWKTIGSWSIASDEEDGGAAGMHVVYTQPGVVKSFRKTGKFPDGAVLIKELYSTRTEGMTTGLVSRLDKPTGWFVMVKDTGNKYPGNPLWGDGWGWAYFDARDPSTPVTKDYQNECKDCHVPAQDRDWVYTEGYPILHK